MPGVTTVSVNGLEGLTLSLDDNQSNSVTMTLFGGHIISWICQGEEQLFMSKTATYDGQKAIRGGIPLVFPQFGRPLQIMAQHGFARNSMWTKISDGNPLSMTVSLSDSEESRAVFPHAFKLLYTVTLLPDQLTISLSAENPEGTANAFQCHTLLHTYFACDTASTRVKVQSLQLAVNRASANPSASLTLASH
jgi:glucose-6-phosphate 1-epimerase